MSFDPAKQGAAEKALEEVRDGMVLGLGTGSTAAVFVALLIEHVKQENLRIIGIPTSEATARQAKEGGIPLSDFSQHPILDITFDGADTVEFKNFTLIKGLGGAMLREKIVAQVSKRLVIMIDETKIPTHFGGIVPIEIVQFGLDATLSHLRKLGQIELRKDKQSGDLYVTDNGNFIADLALLSISDPAQLELQIKKIAGVVETGLFIGMADRIIVGKSGGAEVHDFVQRRAG